MIKNIGQFIAAFAGDIAVLIFAVVAVVASFTAGSAEAYGFPRLISALLLLLCLINGFVNFRRHVLLSSPLLLARKLFPAALIIVLYIGLADIISFYISSTAAFVALSYFYRGEKFRLPLLLVATAVFILFIYLLFTVLLQVQTPEPFWVD